MNCPLSLPGQSESTLNQKAQWKETPHLPVPYVSIYLRILNEPMPWGLFCVTKYPAPSWYFVSKEKYNWFFKKYVGGQRYHWGKTLLVQWLSVTWLMLSFLKGGRISVFKFTRLEMMMPNLGSWDTCSMETELTTGLLYFQDNMYFERRVKNFLLAC